MASCFFSRVQGARTLVSVIAVLAGLVFQAPADAAPAQIKSVRYWQSPESTRVVFDLSGPVKYSLNQSGNQIVLDLPDAATALKVDSVPITSDLISKVRTETVGSGLRVTLDLKHPARPKHFTLKPYQQYGDRLVVDLYDAANEPPPPPPALAPGGHRDIVIAIDAGHGGDDPGASGPHGTQEKDVTLAIAKRLAEAFNKEQGMKAVLTRKGDYFIPLMRRPELARQMRADLFISIHADGFTDPRARGSSVWTLSPRGAKSTMGRWLENSENASDLMGGTETVSLGDKEKVLAEVLLDLSMTHSMSASYDVGKAVLKRIGEFSPLHKREVQQAAFIVLKSPDIPSILVETAFISNPKEEKLLSSRAHQDKLIDAIVDGVHGYMLHHPPPGAEYALKGAPQPSIMPVSYPPAPETQVASTATVAEAPAQSKAQPVAADSGPSTATPVQASSDKPETVAVTAPTTMPVKGPTTTSPKPARPLYLNTIPSSLAYAKRVMGVDKGDDGKVPATKPAPAKMAPTRHKVKSGESLSLIAARYKVSLADLREENDLRGDKVLVGQVLTIPTGG